MLCVHIMLVKAFYNPGMRDEGRFYIEKRPKGRRRISASAKPEYYYHVKKQSTVSFKESGVDHVYSQKYF